MNYTSLINRYRFNDSVLVIPIICTEFLLISLFNMYNVHIASSEYSEVEDCISRMDWNEYLNKHKPRLRNRLTKCSLENVCKEVVNTSKYMCLRNKVIYGRYYKIDCFSCQQHMRCKLNCKFDLSLKSELLVATYPCRTVNDLYLSYLESLGFAKQSVVDVVTIKDERMNFYNCLCDAFNTPRIKVL